MPECEASYRGASMCQFECLDGLSDEATKFFSAHDQQPCVWRILRGRSINDEWRASRVTQTGQMPAFSCGYPTCRAGSHRCGDGAL